MVGRVALFVAGLAVLGAGCDAGSDDTENGSKSPPSTDPAALPPDIVEACRGVYERLPPATRDATDVNEFIERCVARASGKPDPGIPPTS